MSRSANLHGIHFSQSNQVSPLLGVGVIRSVCFGTYSRPNRERSSTHLRCPTLAGVNLRRGRVGMDSQWRLSLPRV